MDEMAKKHVSFAKSAMKLRHKLRKQNQNGGASVAKARNLDPKTKLIKNMKIKQPKLNITFY